MPEIFKTIHPVRNSAYVADFSVLILVVAGILYLNVIDAIKLCVFYIDILFINKFINNKTSKR